jgi:hypothetical protein
MKNKSINQLGILVQAVLVVSLLYMVIMTLFIREFQVPLIIILGLTLLCMAYNNATIYKKRGMTVAYVVVGVISLLSVMFG